MKDQNISRDLVRFLVALFLLGFVVFMYLFGIDAVLEAI